MLLRAVRKTATQSSIRPVVTVNALPALCVGDLHRDAGTQKDD